MNTSIFPIHVSLLNREQKDTYSFAIFTSFGSFIRYEDKEKIHNETTAKNLKKKYVWTGVCMNVHHDKHITKILRFDVTQAGKRRDGTFH